MQFILPLLYSLLFILLVHKISFFAIKGISRTQLSLLFILKLLAGALVYLVYTYYYPLSDFHIYFSDGKILLEQLFGTNSSQQMQHWNSEFESVLFNDSRTIIVVNAILHLFSFGNIYVHLVFFCFFSFVGLTALYKSFILHFPDKNKQLIISIFFVPTILFWSSAALKESLVIALVGLIIYISNFGLKPRYNLKQGLVLTLLILLLLLVKIYVGIALFPVLVANFIVGNTSARKIVWKYLLVFVSAFIILFLTKTIHPDYNILQLIADKQAKAISEARGGVFLVNNKNFICVNYSDKNTSLILQKDSSYKIKEGSNFLSWKLDNMADTTFINDSKDTADYWVYYSVTPAQSVLKLNRIRPNLIDFILFSPIAIRNALFQPDLFHFKSWFHKGVAIENILIILILILAVALYDKTAIAKKEVLLFCFTFSITIFLLIGITTPVIGSIIRYRTIGLLFFVSVLFVMIDINRIRKSKF